MDLRVCPNCNKELGSHALYFCAECGSALPKNLVRNDTSGVRVLKLEPDSTSKKALVKSTCDAFIKVLDILNVKGLLLTALAAALSFGIAYYWYINSGL
jgi:uncharacterized Zn finger protein